MQLELFFKKKYVCKFLDKLILRKANGLVQLFCQVTDVTAYDIRHFVTNLQVYESNDTSNQTQNNERCS